MSGKTGISKLPASVSSRWVAAALATLLALCLLAAPRAEAAWLPPRAVSHEGTSARDPQVAVDGEGNVTVAWVSGTSGQDIFVAEHPAGGEWTNSVARIGVAEACNNPRLAVDSAGAAILVADCGSGATEMQAATRSAGGSWSSSVPIPGSGNGQEPRVAIDDSGNAVVVWEASSTVQSNYIKAAGTWEATPLQVSPNAKVSHEPDVTVSPTGRAIAVWLEDGGASGSDPVVQVDSISRQGSATWSGFKFLSGTATGTSPVAASEPQVTMGAGGRFAAWAQVGSPSWVLNNAWGSPGDFGSWGEGGPHISADAAHDVESPRVALDGSGRAVAVWRGRKIENGDFVVRSASTGFINGSWSAQATLASGGGTIALQPDVAVDPAGDVIAVWRLGGTVSALRHPAGGSFALPGTPISNSAHTGFEEPQIAMDAGGDGVAVWSANDTISTHVAVAVDDVTPPVITVAPTFPVAFGDAVHFNATATDAWSSPVTLSWDFGDGANATGGSVSHVYATSGTKTATVTATDAAGNHGSASVSITVTSPPPPPPPPPPNRQVTLTVKVPAQSWKQIAKTKAIKVRCRLDVAGKCAVKADLAAAVATRLGLLIGKGRKEIVVGKGFVQAKAGKFATVPVKLTPKALAGIAAATKPVPVKLAVTATAPGAKPAALSRALKILRP